MKHISIDRERSAIAARADNACDLVDDRIAFSELALITAFSILLL